MSRRNLLFWIALLPLGAALGWTMAWWKQQPSFDARLPIVALPLLVVLSSAAGTVALRKRRVVRPGGRVALRRAPGRPGLTRLVFSALLLWLLYAGLGHDQVTLESLGVASAPHPLAAFAGGALLYGIFAYATLRLVRRLGFEDELEDLALQAHALVVGAIANAVNHLYQGARMQPFHLAVYACAVALLYSPLGLVGAIGLHFGGDLVPMLTLRGDLRRYRLRHSRNPAAAARAA